MYARRFTEGIICIFPGKAKGRGSTLFLCGHPGNSTGDPRPCWQDAPVTSRCRNTSNIWRWPDHPRQAACRPGPFQGVYNASSTHRVRADIIPKKSNQPRNGENNAIIFLISPLCTTSAHQLRKGLQGP